MNSDEKKQIGLRLAQMRAIKKMSQKEIGLALDCPWRTYQNYEAGLRDVSAEFLMKFALYFNVRPEWIIYGQGTPTALDLETIEEVVFQIETVISDQQYAIQPKVKSNILKRLLKKHTSNGEVTVQDIQDYIELAINVE